MNMQKALVKTVGFAALLAVNVIWVAEAAARGPPPIQGVTGTIATEASMERNDRRRQRHSRQGQARASSQRTKHGPQRRCCRRGGLGGLKKGTRVVIVRRSEESQRSSGLNRRPESRRPDNLCEAVGRQHSDARLSDEAAADADAVSDAGARVIVYYRNESGQRVAKHFKRVS